MNDTPMEKIYSSLLILNAIKHVEYALVISDPNCDPEFTKTCIQDLTEIVEAIDEVIKFLPEITADEEYDKEVRKVIETDPLFVIIEERLGKGMLTIN